MPTTETTIRVVEHEHWAQITREFIRDIRVSHIAFRVYVYILDRAGEQETAFPSMRLIADQTTMAKSSVQKAITELETLGWLQVERSQRAEDSVHIPVNHYLIFKSLTATVPRDGTDSIPRDGTAQYRQSVQKKNQLLSNHSSLSNGGAALASMANAKMATWERSELWDALSVAHGEPASKSERSYRGKIVNDLIAAGVTPEEYPVLVRAFVSKWDGKQPAPSSVANRIGEYRDYVQHGPITAPDADELVQQRIMAQTIEETNQ